MQASVETLVGRERELTAAADVCRGAPAGRGSTLVVTGQPGIGGAKARLAPGHGLPYGRMEPLFNALIVGLVPQPTQVPPPPFEREALQKVFFEVSRDFPYSQFGLLPGDQGAQLLNPPHDRVLLQPALLQVQSPIGSGPNDATAERVREKAVTVLAAAAERLEIRQFLNCGIKVTANIPAPESGARDFVANNLFSQAERIDLLGTGFFGGGIKVWRFDDGQKIEVLLIEPLLSDDAYIYVDYDVNRTPMGSLTSLDDLPAWIDAAFKFVREKTIMFLEEAS